jgi:hypothetical protein
MFMRFYLVSEFFHLTRRKEVFILILLKLAGWNRPATKKAGKLLTKTSREIPFFPSGKRPAFVKIDYGEQTCQNDSEKVVYKNDIETIIA